MSKQIQPLIVLIIFLLNACNNDEPKFKKIQPRVLDSTLNKSIERPAGVLKYSQTTPFSETNFIEVISYPNREIWDTSHRAHEAGGGIEMNRNVIADGKIRIPDNKIKDRIRLTDIQAKKFFDVLYNFDCSNGSGGAPCFAPRHSYVFYNKAGEAFASLEICFECGEVRKTGTFVHIDWCPEQIDKIAGFSKQIGVKYFGN